MEKKVLVIYYSQTGQLFDIVKSITKPLAEANTVKLYFEELKPKPPFPFPWTAEQFFQAFPESVKTIPCDLEPLKISSDQDFDLVIIAYQPWYLSPSIPFHAFFQSEETKRLLAGKPVITVIGCRNMWAMAQEKVKQYIREANGQLVGNIVLRDKAPNLLSVVSIVRWLLKNKKGRYLKVIPPAGVSQSDIVNAERFGRTILGALNTGSFAGLQENLLVQGAVEILPGLVMIEKNGSRIFNIWASFILKKGGYGDQARKLRLTFFKYYLFAVIYLISPLGSLFFILTKPFRIRAIKKQIAFYKSINM
jgi:hypothetical protein